MTNLEIRWDEQTHQFVASCEIALENRKLFGQGATEVEALKCLTSAVDLFYFTLREKHR